MALLRACNALKFLSNIVLLLFLILCVFSTSSHSCVMLCPFCLCLADLEASASQSLYEISSIYSLECLGGNSSLISYLLIFLTLFSNSTPNTIII